jgi:hypothetical protein
MEGKTLRCEKMFSRKGNGAADFSYHAMPTRATDDTHKEHVSTAQNNKKADR